MPFAQSGLPERGLVNQPTKRPTRKVWAAIIAAAVIGAIRAALEHFAPHITPGPIIEAIRPFVEGGLIAAAAYIARERA